MKRTQNIYLYMARHNWVANNKSYRAELKINSNQEESYKDIVTQNISFMTELQWRLRLGYTDTKKVDADNLDGRLEFNYLF